MKKTTKTTKNKPEKGVNPPPMPFNLLPYASFGIVLNRFSMLYSLSLAACITLLIIYYSRIVTVTSLSYLQYTGGNRTAYRLCQSRLALLLEKGLIVNDGKGNYSLSSKCVEMFKSVLVGGESAKILVEIDKRIARSNAYRLRKNSNIV